MRTRKIESIVYIIGSGNSACVLVFHCAVGRRPSHDSRYTVGGTREALHRLFLGMYGVLSLCVVRNAL